MNTRILLSATVLVGSVAVICSAFYAARLEAQHREIALVLVRVGLGLFMLSCASMASHIFGEGGALTLLQVIPGLSAAVLFTEASIRLCCTWKPSAQQ